MSRIIRQVRFVADAAYNSSRPLEDVVAFDADGLPLEIGAGASDASSVVVDPSSFTYITAEDVQGALNNVDVALADVNGLVAVNRVIARPVNGESVASSTPASLPTPWTAAITVVEGSDVDFNISAFIRCAAGQPTSFAFLYRDGTLIAQSEFGGSYAVNGMTVPIHLIGSDEGLVAGTYNYEVKLRTHGGETINIINTVGATIAYDDAMGKSYMRLLEVRA